ncbi:hypothetical protein IQ272_03755 [Chroococcidiopsidales cyanobacterium LEGE 13417]|uniref:hypothetical protein n=1 Tax=Chroococcidiopsis sp. CCALA 051 TaxID=869949 RepID=UPI0013049BE2|nr:hypothetical protein [Chroococcidiopsis sp. CCALA 051]MBE9015272.1 hypothetical protein [Chroococcidiopsidales cyanobacterium LEGE 13417]
MHFIAILDCMDDIGRGAQLCAPTKRVLHPIENRYQYLCSTNRKVLVSRSQLRFS